MGNQESSRSLYAIPGLDYVAHEDIIPYVSAEKTPLNHELFDKFLMPNPKGGKIFISILILVPYCEVTLTQVPYFVYFLFTKSTSGIG